MAKSLIDALNETLQSLQHVLQAVSEARSTDDLKRVQGMMAAMHSQQAVVHLPELLDRAYKTLAETRDAIHRTRAGLKDGAMQSLHATHNKLHEVTSAAETAATQLLDGLDRALAKVDAIDAAVSGAEEAQEAVVAVRNELNDLFLHLQFQDITSQQIAGVSEELSRLEHQIAELLSLFEGAVGMEDLAVVAGQKKAYNESASMLGVAEKQALADDAFRSTGG